MAMAVGWAAPGDGLPELAREYHQSGIAMQERGDLEGAALQFRNVLLLEPTWADAVLRLGEVHLANGDVDEAVAVWRRQPFNADCVEASGRALLDAGRGEEAVEWFRRLRILSSDAPWVDLLIARALAASKPVDALDSIERYIGRRTGDSEDLLPAVTATAAQFISKPDKALALIDRAIAAQPALAEALERTRRTYQLRSTAVELMGAAPVELTAADRAQLESGRRQFADGEVEAALKTLERLADRVSRNPEIWSALADVREAKGDIEGAEYALLLARRLAPLDSQLRTRYAHLLSEHYAGRFDGEAASLLDRPLEGRADPALLWRQAELILGGGDAEAGGVEASVATLRRYLKVAPGGPHAREAKDLLEDLERPRVEAPRLPPVKTPVGVPEQAWFDIHLAQVLWETESAADREEALDLLETALAEAPKLRKAINLKGRIEVSQGRDQAAIASFTRSLELDPDQPNVVHELAVLLSRTGQPERAETMLVAAAESGSGPARFELARRDASAWRWWTARERLDTYFDVASSGPLYDEAQALRDALDRRILEFWLALVATVSLVVALPVFWMLRRRAGAPLRTLLDRAPGTYREVARIVAALRHEVLKHNISALPGVANALESGDTASAQWAAERLFAAGGAVPRFHRYIRELEDLGRRHGVTLNLRHRDPVMGPILVGFERLSSLRRRLETGNVRAVPELRAISEVLNERGYDALGEVLRGVCVVPLQRTLFDEAWNDVLGEPAFQDIQPPEWSVDCPEDSVSVRAFRGDLHDILVNLLRNALAATESSDGLRLGVRLDTEEDEITGLERVEIRVRDEAPRRISTAMIRGRYIERGLGLAVDMISRAGGSIHVEDEPGWSKAVVVRLPMEEGVEA